MKPAGLELALHYAYLDESGNVTPFQDSERFLAVATITGNDAARRAIESHVKRLRRKARIRLEGELKAADATEKQRIRLLEAIADEDIMVVAVTLDKSTAYRRPEDPEEWYRKVVSLAAWHCANHCENLRLILDKRYTNKALRDKLEAAVWVRLGALSPRVRGIDQLDSHTQPGLQAADYVAWRCANTTSLTIIATTRSYERR